jgi:hypothetical protein
VSSPVDSVSYCLCIHHVNLYCTDTLQWTSPTQRNCSWKSYRRYLDRYTRTDRHEAYSLIGAFLQLLLAFAPSRITTSVRSQMSRSGKTDGLATSSKIHFMRTLGAELTCPPTSRDTCVNEIRQPLCCCKSCGDSSQWVAADWQNCQSSC